MKTNRSREKNYKWREVNNMKKILCLCCLLLGLLITANAWADLTFDIGIPNAALSPYPSPYATVDISLTDSTHATVTFTGLSGVPYDSTTLNYLLGDGNSAALNVNASSFSVGNFSWGGGNGSTAFSSGGAGNVSDFGNFNLTITDFDGYTSAVTSLTFTLTNTGGGTWTTVNDVLTPDNNGYLAAGHIYIQDTSDTTNALVTGFAGNGTRVPEPSTLLLLGAGLLGVGFVRRRFKK
jgi:hypothetical protein